MFVTLCDGRSSVQLYVSEALWKQKQAHGFRLMNELFDYDKNAASLMAVVKPLLDPQALAQRRSRDFFSGR